MQEAKSLRRSPRLSKIKIEEALTLAVLHHESVEPEYLFTPKPLKIYHPKSKSKSKCKSRFSNGRNEVLRRSPRLMATSIGVTEGKSESALLLNLSDSLENECELVSPCLRESKRKLDSLEDSGTYEKMPSNRESLRRSPRFSGQKSIDLSEITERKLRRKSDVIRIAFPRSSMEEKTARGLSPSSPVDLMLLRSSSMARNSTKIGEKRLLRRSPRGLTSSSVIDECVEIEALQSSKKNSEVIPKVLSSSSMATNLAVKIGEERLLRRSPRGLTSSSSLVNDDSVEIEALQSPMELVSLSVTGKLRRSPRGLTWSSMVDECFEEIEGLDNNKKKKKKAIKKRREKSKVSRGCNSLEEEVKGRKRSGSCFFVGEVVPEEEARERWGWRYQLKNRSVMRRSLAGNPKEEDELNLKVKCHYTQAQINGCIFHLGDCALIRGEGRQKHIGRIMEFFQTTEEEDYFRVQWFYKAEDTVMKEEAFFHDEKRIFYSTIMNDNLLDCILSKLNVAQVTPQLNLKSSSIPPPDFYYDMEYCLDYSTFRNLPRDNSIQGYELPPLSCPESILSLSSTPMLEYTSLCEPFNAELTMLDVYAGCGAMSTGLCFGARLSGVNLVTRWAIDSDSWACESMRLNHPETQVKNQTAEDFLELLKHWEKLCKKFVIEDVERSFPSPEGMSDVDGINSDNDITSDELEVSSLVDISYGDVDELGKQGLKFKVRWKGYGPSEDTWEPIEGLSNCQELIQDFVINGFKNKILPLPGDVGVICGGPPCQGISGYNRFRSVDAPLADERNRQLIVFMDIVEYLKPKFVLMENVMDILRFDKGSLGRYALSRLVHMNYQARVGIMAAGCYGLPQFRLRVFFWGALPSEELPQFPLPTHDVVVKYWPPPEFERNVVAYDEGQPPELEDAVFLSDAISDLPEVTNYESSDEMPYSMPPETDFQKYIRSINHDMLGSESRVEQAVLYDHRPHQLFEDDYIRVCRIPRRKGANFRDLPGVIVGDDNVVQRDTTKEPVLLPSGRPMVPEYALTFEQGKSKRPFARLWWDETMATMVTYPNCHCQAVLHPEQDRVLTVRECARLQGFPDSYSFCGTVKKRYRQVGNAVAIPVAKALGYALGMASQKLVATKQPLLKLPPNFAYSNNTL